MSAHHVPPGLVEGSVFPVSRGFVENGWFYEEVNGECRQGYRLLATLHEEESPYQRIAVYDTAFFGKLLTLDDSVMFTERDEFVYHEMLVHVPLCSLKDPKSVLIIGGGDCGCLREVLKHPTIERVVQCDIDERVTRVAERHFDWVAPACSDARAELVFQDGVGFVENNVGKFDLIIVDSTDPEDAAVGLFLRDFYAKVGRALRPGGIMTAQTESPHWDARMFSCIYEELNAAFRSVNSYLIMIPSYPSGCWSLAYASTSETTNRDPDPERAAALESQCRYYSRDVHRASFALPTFARQGIDGADPFARFTEHVRDRS